jgi:hypothetical protein
VVLYEEMPPRQQGREQDVEHAGREMNSLAHVATKARTESGDVLDARQRLGRADGRDGRGRVRPVLADPVPRTHSARRCAAQHWFASFVTILTGRSRVKRDRATSVILALTGAQVIASGEASFVPRRT